MQKLTCNNIGFYEFIAKIAIKSRQTKNNANLSSNQLNSYLYIRKLCVYVILCIEYLCVDVRTNVPIPITTMSAQCINDKFSCVL